MASLEMTTPDTQEDQKDSSAVLNDTLNFSGVTPTHFGISVQSFTPASSPSSKRKNKSRLVQLKARRRSSVGVRGSPETNSLIRFIAQQKMKTPTPHCTPEHVKSSPFLPRVASTLKQKMASFQSLMSLEESEVCEAMPRQDSNTGGCIKTRDYLSDRTNLDAGKENHSPLMTPTPSKRRRMGPIQGCEMEIREASAPTLHLSLKELKEEEQPVRQGPVQSSGRVEGAQAELISPPFYADCEPPVSYEVKASSPTENQQEGVFELQSLSRPTPDDPAAASPAQPASPFQISLPSLLEMKPTGEVDSTVGPTVKRKKKQVRFGRPLSPELFDKTLPPSTPLQKGSTPARAPTPGGSLKLQSLLKTPQRNEPQSPTQQDLSSPSMFGASPVHIILQSRRVSSTAEDGEEKDTQIVFPSREEINSAVTDDKGFMWDAQPLNLNDAFDKEFLSQIPTESDTKPNTFSLMDTLQTPEPICLKEKETQPQADGEAPAPGRCSNRRKKAAPEHGSTTESPAPSSSRKRKQPEESKPVKRSTRSAAKLASGKMKMTSTATCRWKREVDHSLYGSRKYASKNPALSPITERWSFISQSPVVPESLCTAQDQEPQPHIFNTGQSGNGDPATEVATGDISAPNTFTAPEVSVCVQESGTRKRRRRRMSGLRVGGKAIKGRKVISEGDLPDQMGEKVDECCEGQTTISQQESKETLSTQTILENLGDATEELCAASFAESLCTDSDGKAECPARLDSPTSVCPPAGEEFKDTLSLSAQRKVKRGRRSQKSQPEEDKMNHKVEEKGRGEQAASQQENNRSGSDSHEEERAAHLCLAPWQADFNFEDVFKPVAARGQRSVRRSLRNQSNPDHGSNGSGLVWLPHTSPESSKEARRRTRGRRLSGALPAQPPVPEEDAAGTETA